MENRLPIDQWIEVQERIIAQTKKEFTDVLEFGATIQSTDQLKDVFDQVRLFMEMNPGNDVIVIITNEAKHPERQQSIDPRAML